jgi:alanyl-tRNA synthetase
LVILKTRQRELDALKSQATGGQVAELVQQAIVKDGISFVLARVDGIDVPQMRELGDRIRDQLSNGGVVVLAGAHEERAQAARHDN